MFCLRKHRTAKFSILDFSELLERGGSGDESMRFELGR